jgi:hypothetical protein
VDPAKPSHEQARGGQIHHNENPAAEFAVLGQQAVADAPVHRQHQVEERGDRDDVAGAEVKPMQHEPFRGLIGGERYAGDGEAER